MYHNAFFFDTEMGSVILSPRDIAQTNPLESFSKDLEGIVHTLRYDQTSGEFRLSHYGEESYTVALSLSPSTNVSKIDFTYNQNNNIHIAYELSGSIYQKYEFGSTDFHGIVCTGTDPFVQLDVLDDRASSLNDVILLYRTATHLAFRIQREDFETEHLITTAHDLSTFKILNFGANSRNRLEIYAQTNYRD